MTGFSQQTQAAHHRSGSTEIFNSFEFSARCSNCAATDQMLFQEAVFKNPATCTTRYTQLRSKKNMFWGRRLQQGRQSLYFLYCFIYNFNYRDRIWETGLATGRDIVSFVLNLSSNGNGLRLLGDWDSAI